jgi:hypothetical protein
VKKFSGQKRFFIVPVGAEFFDAVSIFHFDLGMMSFKSQDILQFFCGA